jgi:hypothetical protein
MKGTNLDDRFSQLLEVIARQQAEIAGLQAKLASQEARLAILEQGPVPALQALPTKPTSRRRMLKQVGAVAAGLAAATLTTSPQPSQAATGDAFKLGGANQPDNPGETTLLDNPSTSALSPLLLWARNNSSSKPNLPTNFRIALAGTTGGNDLSGYEQIGVYGAAKDTGWGVYGDCSGGIGVNGVSEGGTGVQGTSAEGSGVSGVSEKSHGVQGSSTSGIGVNGVSTGDTGVSGIGYSFGVSGESLRGTGASGYSPLGTGVSGLSIDGSGVKGSSVNEYGGFFNSLGLAPLRLLPAKTTGAPAYDAHQRGEFYVDDAGSLYYCVSDGTPGVWRTLATP